MSLLGRTCAYWAKNRVFFGGEKLVSAYVERDKKIRKNLQKFVKISKNWQKFTKMRAFWTVIALPPCANDRAGTAR